MVKTISSIVTLIILGTVGVAVFMVYMQETQPYTAYETKTIQVDNAKLEVFVADTMEKRTQGLMNIPKLGANSGMLFVFPDMAQRTFWNKNTLIPLDLIWVADEHVVGFSKLPSIIESKNIVTVSSPGSASEVIEVSAGWVERHGIKIGDELMK